MAARWPASGASSPDPGLEQVAQDVQGVGLARLGAQEVDELGGDLRPIRVDVQIRNEENRHEPQSRRIRGSGWERARFFR